MVEVVATKLVLEVKNPMAYEVLEPLNPKQLEARTEIHVATNPASYRIEMVLVPWPETMVALPNPVSDHV